MSPSRRPGRLRSLLDRLRRRAPRVPDAPPEADEPPAGVREPRRPRPSAGSGTALAEPQTEEDER